MGRIGGDRDRSLRTDLDFQPRAGARPSLHGRRELVRTWGQGQFREPHQVRIDRKGDVWLVDSGLHVVRKYTPEGKLLLTLGTPGAGRRFDAFQSSNGRGGRAGGDVFVADGYGNNRIVHFDRARTVRQTWGSWELARTVQPAPFDRARFAGPGLRR